MAAVCMAADAADLMSRISRCLSEIVASGAGMYIELQCCSFLPNTSRFWALSLPLLAPLHLPPSPDRAGTRRMWIILIAQGSC